MRIKIKQDALSIYVRDHTDYNGDYHGHDWWESFLKQVSGKELKVDQENLFKHEFDVLPISGVSDATIRILDDYVDMIIDDQRIGKARCELCNSVSLDTQVCSHCGRSDYLDVF